MRIGIRIGLDRAHLHIFAADLRNDIGILVLNADRLDQTRRLRQGRNLAGAKPNGSQQAGNGKIAQQASPMVHFTPPMKNAARRLMPEMI
jgi:hypothetical protein